MAKFRCISSGTIIEFTTPYDIDSMRGHPDYERLDEEGHAVEEKEEHKPLPFNSPQRGRPKKVK